MSCVSPLAAQAGLSGSEPPVTRRTGACGPSPIRRHSGSVYGGCCAGSDGERTAACAAISCPIQATVEPSALIDAPSQALGKARPAGEPAGKTAPYVCPSVTVGTGMDAPAHVGSGP